MFGLFKRSLGPAGRLVAPAVFGSNFAWDGDSGQAAEPAAEPASRAAEQAPEIVLRVTAPAAPSFWMLIYGADLERITGRGTVDAEAISEQEAKFVIRPAVPDVSLAHVLDESRYVPERIATGAEGAIQVTLAPIAPDGQPMRAARTAGLRFESPAPVAEQTQGGGTSLWVVQGDEPKGNAAEDIEAPARTDGAPAFASWLQHPNEPSGPPSVDEPALASSQEDATDPWFRPTDSTSDSVGQPATPREFGALPSDPNLVHAGILGDAVASVDWLSLLRRDPASSEPQTEPAPSTEAKADPWFDWVPATAGDPDSEPATAEEQVFTGAQASDQPSAEEAEALGSETSPWISEASPAEVPDDMAKREADDDDDASMWQLATPETAEPSAAEQEVNPTVGWAARPSAAAEPDEAATSPEGQAQASQPTSLFDAPLVALPDPETADTEDSGDGSEPTAVAPLAWPPLNVVNPGESADADDVPVRGSAAPSTRPIAHSPVVLVQDLYRRPTRDSEPEPGDGDAEQTDEPGVEDDPQLIELAQRKPRVRGVNTYFETLGNPPIGEPEVPEQAPSQAPRDTAKERKPKFKLLSLFKKKASVDPPAAVVDGDVDFDRFQCLEPFWRRLAVLSVELGLGSSEGASGGLARAVESGVQDVSNLVVAGGITEEQFTDLAALALGVPRLRVSAATSISHDAIGSAVPVGRVGHTLYVATSSLDPGEAIAPFEGRAPQTQALLVSRAELDHLSRGAIRSIPVKDDDAPPRLGEVLVTFGHITNTQLDRALQRQEREQGSVGYLLRLSGEIDEATFIESLALQLGLPWLRVEQIRPYADAVSLIPTEVAERYGVLGLAKTVEGVYVGFIDALDEEARDAVRGAVNVPVLPTVVGRDGLARTFGRVFAA